MTWINLTDVEQQLAAAGIATDKPLTFDARIQRWKTADSKGGERPGWSRLKEWVSKAGNTYIVGAFGVWAGTDDGYTKIELPRRDDPQRPALTDEDIAAARAAQKAAAKAVADERRAEAKRAAGWAAQVWSHCQPVGEAGHEYLTRKGIAANGARIWAGVSDVGDGAGLRMPGLDEANHWRLQKSVGALVVPMHDINGNVVGIQFIFPKGHEFADKQFWPTGMAMGGSFGVIGGWRRGGVLLLTEGFATGGSLAEATAQPVAYAFAANNLGKAAKAIRAKYKAVKILHCADDDYLVRHKPGCLNYTLQADPICSHCGVPHEKKNAGVDAAQLAASEIEHAAWLAPDFIDADGHDLRNGKKLTDFNDLAALTSPLVLANQINDKLDALKWRDAATGAGGSGNHGGGEPLADGRKRAQSVMPLDDIVARFVPLDDGTGKYVFDVWTNKIAQREQMITLLPAGVRGDDIKRHPVWIERGAYYLDEVGFDPSGGDKAVRLNTWRGWPIEPKAGSCERLLELLRYLCSADPNADAIYRWVLRWMAYPLQHPGAKMSSAIIMHGPQGTGKSTIWQCLAKIYGDYATVLNQRGLEDRFNADWVDSKLFILAEEVVTRAEMWHIKNELKELISGEWIRVNPKNVAAYRQRNQVNGVFLSNENQPLPLDNDDRRHCVIYTPPAVGETFYDEVYLEIEAGGTAALYHHLMQIDLGDFHPKKRPPMTEAKTALIALSSPSEQRFVLDWIGGDIGLPICPALATDVYAAYLKWCRANGESRPRPSNQFHGSIDRLPGWEKRRTHVYESTHYSGKTVVRLVIIPPPQSMQAAGTAQGENDSVSVWLTNGIFDFANATRGEEWQGRATG